MMNNMATEVVVILRDGRLATTHKGRCIEIDGGKRYIEWYCRTGEGTWECIDNKDLLESLGVL